MATILVADDDQLLRAIIRDHLERADHTVLEAGDGIAAIEIALDERPECLLLDVMMPLARGLEVVRRVRQEESWHPTIAMISARTRVTDRLNALDAGADVYFEKPFEPDVLLEVIERHLAQTVPSRLVDVLGPIWTAVAVERLVRDALARRSTGRLHPDRVQELFAHLVARSVGRLPASDPDPTEVSTDAARLMWEDTLRVLLRDAREEPIPTVTDLATPDALAMVERLIAGESLARHRVELGRATIRRPHPGGDVDPRWSEVLRVVLGDGDPAPAPAAARPTGFDAILRAGGPASLDPLQALWIAIAGQPGSSRRVEEPA